MKISVFYDHIQEASEQTGKPIGEILTEAALAGICAVEMNATQLLRDKEHILTELTEAGLTVSCLYDFFDFGNDPDLTRALSVIDLAAELHTDKVLIVPGFVSEQEGNLFYENRKDYDVLSAYMEDNPKVEGMIWALTELVDAAKGKNITVVMEDFDSRTAPYSTRNGVKFFLEHVHGLKFAMDCGNFAYSDEDAYQGYWQLSGSVVHVHAKERGEDPAMEHPGKFNKGLLPVVTGSGYMPIERILKDLLEQGYDDTIAIEHFGAVDQLETMRASAAYLTAIINSYHK